MTIIWKGSVPGDWREGRSGHAIYGIVIHVSTASMGSLDNQFDDPESHVSAHYGVSKSGEIHQYVTEDSQAFHAGTVVRPTCQWCLNNPGVNPNLAFIGIEHEGLATDIWPDAQYQASAELIADICQRNSIPVDALHIVPHCSIRADKTCPGLCDMARLIGAAQLALEAA